jgi:ABC-type bacteriocin/lantibiotic exporter with double-glycine peptidase domain
MHGTRPEFHHLLLTIIGLGAASCATPLAFGLFAGWLLPTGNLAALWGLLGGLLAFSLFSACLQALQGLTWLRVEGRSEGVATAALIDRLLKLPVTFFKGYGSGDLGNRVLSLSALRTVITAVVFSSLAPALIGLFSIFLLVVINGAFAVVSLVIAAVLLTTAALIAGRVAEAQSTADAMASSNANLLIDVVTGIHKLRVTATEDLFLSRWAQNFSAQRRAQAGADRLDDHYQSLGLALPLLVLAAACCLGFLLPMNPSGEGRLIAAQIAMLQVAFASHALGNAWIKLRRTQPLRDKLLPLLQAPVESRRGGESPGVLTGALRLTHVSFSYALGMPPVLDDLSLTVRAGEFVALVGPSGCGKSTILRLLLGFETPDRGTVEWDGRNLDRLDMDAFRRQVGTVLQSGTILPGTIRQFIAGPNNLGDEDIWEALRLARVDEEIRRLPMGLHSGLGNNGGGFSGGQRQRLLLARSLATRPRVLILDEATSALDNRTQAEVMDTLRSLDCTRIVVAHRLSTIRYADRIITMVGGKLVQAGTYDELVSIPGPFQDLVRRQQLD